MDVAGLDRAAIFAHADGAAVAALFAATHPERVSALALFNPIVRTAWADDYPWGARPEDEHEFRAQIWRLWHTDDPTVDQIEYFSGDVGVAGDDPAFRRWFARSLRYLMTAAEFEAYSDVWMDTDVRHVLPSIQAPTTVLHAPESAEDRGLNAAIAAAIPGATVRELPGVYFIPMIGDIDAIVDAVAEHLRVDRPTPATDRILASVLFTDIVDSTRRAAELGDATWKDLLAQHDEIERDRLARFGGRFVHTTGDGMLATFDGPARAVHCALEIAHAVQPLGLEIRAGIHTGEVERSQGEVQGLAVHIGARVAAKAGPSEVFVSRTVKDLVAGSGLAFEDAGEHELKGVPDTWRLYRVVG
jgi:class 3 adenylate cyclase